MGKVLLTGLILFVIACNNVDSKKHENHYKENNYTGQMPKDTLLACLRELGAILNAGNFDSTSLKQVFLRRSNYNNIRLINYGTTQLNDSTLVVPQKTGNTLDIYLNTFFNAKDSLSWLFKITNPSTGSSQTNYYLCLADFDKQFGMGTLMPWHNKLGIPPPKEYLPPVRYWLAGNSSSRGAYISVISERPEDKNFNGILYIDVFYSN